ncbi:MAG: hypothetical protein KJP04_11095, partial [Arenicella sp.]|nr:hypothetical protein [Arenicella sp.]
LILAAVNEGALGIGLVAVIVVSSLMAVVYVWRVFEAAYFRQPQGTATPVREAPIELLTVTWLAVLANIYFGVASVVPVSLSSTAAELLLGHMR